MLHMSIPLILDVGTLLSQECRSLVAISVVIKLKMIITFNNIGA